MAATVERRCPSPALAAPHKGARADRNADALLAHTQSRRRRLARAHCDCAAALGALPRNSGRGAAPEKGPGHPSASAAGSAADNCSSRSPLALSGAPYTVRGPAGDAPLGAEAARSTTTQPRGAAWPCSSCASTCERGAAPLGKLANRHGGARAMHKESKRAIHKDRNRSNADSESLRRRRKCPLALALAPINLRARCGCATPLAP